MIRNFKVEIKRMWREAKLTTTQMAGWLNDNKFKPPRAAFFTNTIVAGYAHEMGLGKKKRVTNMGLVALAPPTADELKALADIDFARAQQSQHLVYGEETIDKISALVLEANLKTSVKVALIAAVRKSIYSSYNNL